MGAVTDRIRDNAERKAFAALLALVLGTAVLILPPITYPQLAAAEKALRQPIAAAVVAVVILLASAWRVRIALALVIGVGLFALAQISFYVVTTSPGRSATNQASGWRNVPLATGAHGTAENTPDVFGRARLDWSGDALRLDLHSETGLTQQGFYLNAGSLTSRFFFSVRIDKIDGGDAVICPLLFGIQTNRSYFTFRLQKFGSDAPRAIAYQIIPNSQVFTSGFHGVLLDESPPLPYVNHWTLITPNSRNKSTLAIMGDGDMYTFYVDNREVFNRRIDTVPTHTVAVGDTVLANGLKSDAVCQFDRISLKVDPKQG